MEVENFQKYIYNKACLEIVLYNDVRAECALSFGFGAGCMAAEVLLRNHHL